eukprot:TRINITY_DN10144_c0_g1_i1.p1 TRINITY_DN10144_c0_g1~~TRINITY_DN10144_c0_g1_i1.p1  ORF type:complete len:1703 (+),score=475.43 TRINITY_DN10144_c0_g1_i1:96-5111(+)
MARDGRAVLFRGDEPPPADSLPSGAQPEPRGERQSAAAAEPDCLLGALEKAGAQRGSEGESPRAAGLSAPGGAAPQAEALSAVRRGTEAERGGRPRTADRSAPHAEARERKKTPSPPRRATPPAQPAVRQQLQAVSRSSPSPPSPSALPVRYVWCNDVPITAIAGEPFAGRTVTTAGQPYGDSSAEFATDCFAAEKQELREQVPVCSHEGYPKPGAVKLGPPEVPFHRLLRRIRGPSVAATLANAFAAFAKRPCLGQERPDGSGFDWISFGVIGARVERISRLLHDRCPPGAFVALTGPNCVDYVVLILACMRGRLVPVPLNTHFDPTAISAVIEELATSGSGLGAVFAAPSLQCPDAVAHCTAAVAGARERGHLPAGGDVPVIMFGPRGAGGGSFWLSDWEQGEGPQQPAASGAVAPACSRSHAMQRSRYARGEHVHGWSCDRCSTVHPARGMVPDERWFCLRCKEDVCFECVPSGGAPQVGGRRLSASTRVGRGLLAADVYAGEARHPELPRTDLCPRPLMLRVVVREGGKLRGRLCGTPQGLADVEVLLGAAGTLVARCATAAPVSASAAAATAGLPPRKGGFSLIGEVDAQGVFEGWLKVNGVSGGSFVLRPVSEARVAAERNWAGWRCPEGHGLVGAEAGHGAQPGQVRVCDCCDSDIREKEASLCCPDPDCTEGGYDLCERCVSRGRCCGGHPLVEHRTSHLLRITCDRCGITLSTGATALACVRCDYDVCCTCAAAVAEEQKGQVERAVEARRAQKGQRSAVGERSPAVIILYTSGSTGAPKGAIVDEAAMQRELDSLLPGITNTDKTPYEGTSVDLLDTYMAVSSTPYTLLATVICGSRLALYERHQKVFEVTRLVGPSSVSLVPEMWKVLYKDFQARVAAGEDEAKVREEFRMSLGPRCRSLNCGGAKPHPAVMAWLKETFTQCRVTENYASTEAGAITYGVSTGDGWSQVLARVKTKLEDHAQYTSADKPYKRGQLLVFTPTMFQGYLKRADKTSEAFDSDGYYRTGDVVEMRDDDKGGPPWVRIVDRLKSLFKMANGEWVSPEDIERVYLTSPMVEQIFVHGDSSHSTLCAIVVPRGGQGDAAALKKELDRVSEQQAVRRVHRPVQVSLAREPFTAANGQLTQTQKICRPGLQRDYAEEISRMLAEGDRQEEERADQLTSGLVVLLEQLAASAQPPTQAQAKQFSELPWCSAFVNAVRPMLARRFGVEISYDALPDSGALATEPRFLAALQQAVRTGKAQVEKPINWEEEAQLPADVRPSTAPPAEHGGVLLTGVTGFMGPALLRSLLAVIPSGATVYCLHRGKPERVFEALRRHGCWDEAESGQVHPVEGDLGAPLLGLSAEARRDIAERCSLVVHAAATVQHLMGYRRLKETNVASVVEALRLCASGAPKRLVYVSTISVLDGIPAGQPQDESAVAAPAQIAATRSGYAQSKWVGEALVREAAQRGFDCQIWRPGLMSPDRLTGAANVQDWMMRFVRCCALVGAYCAGDRPFNISPVDYAADAVAKAALVPRKAGAAVYHIPTAATTAREFLQLIAGGLADRGHILREVAPAEWARIVEDLATTNPLYNFKDGFKGGMDGCGGQEASRTVAELGLPKVALYDQQQGDLIVQWLVDWDEDVGSLALMERCGMSTHSFFIDPGATAASPQPEDDEVHQPL